MLLEDLIDTYDSAYIKPVKIIYDELIASNVMTKLSVQSAITLSNVLEKLTKLTIALDADSENVEDEAIAKIEEFLTDEEKATLYGAYLLMDKSDE